MNSYDEDEEFYSVMRYDDDYGDIPLREGINVQDLVGTDGSGGVEFEVDQAGQEVNGALPEYHPEDVHKYMAGDALGLNDDEDGEGGDSDDDESPFEKLAKMMTDITGDGGVLKKVLTEGVGGVVPENMTVTCHYSGSLEYSDEPYDSTRLRAKPLRYVLGCGEMIPGLEVGLATMRKKEEAQFLIRPSYAFGERGVPPRIPKSSTILFQVELLDWMEATELQNYFQLPREERKVCDFSLLKKVAEFFLEEGKSSHRQRRFVGATRQFTKGIRAIEDYRSANEEVESEYHRLMIRLCSNACISHMKLNNLNPAKFYADRALQIDPNAIKPLFHLGKAQRMCGDFDQATKTLRKALTLAPKNHTIAMELKEINRYKASMDFGHIAMCQRMFGNASIANDTCTEKVKNPKKDDDTQPESPVSDEFKASIASRLNTFVAGNVMEFSLPHQHLTKSERDCIRKLSVERDLEYREQGEGFNLHIRLCKKRPQRNP